MKDCKLVCRDLTESLFTREVLNEHSRRFKAAKMDKSRGRAWSQCFIPEYFLTKIEGPTKEDSAWLNSRTSPHALPIVSYATCFLSSIVLSDMLPCMSVR